MNDFTERYTSYAKAHGKTPADMLAYDKQRSPGGCMAEYMIWNGGMIRDWKKLNNMRADFPMSDKNQSDYDVWLSEQASRKLAAA